MKIILAVIIIFVIYHFVKSQGVTVIPLGNLSTQNIHTTRGWAGYTGGL